MKDKPQILTLNLRPEATELLKQNSFNIYEGSLGKISNTKNKRGDLKYCLLNHDFPENFHEYDVVIVDLGYTETVDYKKENNTRLVNKSDNNTYLLCEHPQTLFDPRGFSAHVLVNHVKEIMKHDSILIVFQSEDEIIEYKIVEENGNYPSVVGEEEYSIYEFLPVFPHSGNKIGKETKVSIKQSDLNGFLNKYNSKFTYKSVFYHPTIWEENDKKSDPNFYPLVLNRDNEIISFANFINKTGIFVFPQLPDYSLFLNEFMENIAPGILPKVFPYSTGNLWANDSAYYLPNHEKLVQEKKLLFEEWEKKDKKKEQEIDENYEKYKFLHKIITETGDELVKATITFLEWLGFSNVKDMDETDSTILEEDIQIENSDGLLVIELKGIGGTSKDSECSQVSKIKYRRAKERGTFDVSALYIVNHQRHLPPLNRKTPPFSPEQISDAENDERGLLTTLQLFNLYFEIDKGIITKTEARKCLYQYGNLKFIPSNLVLIDTVTETFLKGKVSILNIEKNKLNVGDSLYVESKGRFQIAKIIGLKVDDKPVESVTDGEIGVKTDIKVENKSKIWIKNLP